MIKTAAWLGLIGGTIMFMHFDVLLRSATKGVGNTGKLNGGYSSLPHAETPGKYGDDLIELIHDVGPTCRWLDKRHKWNVSDCVYENLPNYTESTMPEVLFFGDSTMARLWHQFFQQTIPYFLPLKSYEKCNFESRILDRCFQSSDNANRGSIFPDRLRSDERRKPGLGEGPTGFGIGTGFARGCMDCSSCHSRLWFGSNKCKYKPPSFFGVEFSKDVEMQTKEADTTQEATVKLLEAKYNDGRQKLCVVNTGMHDVAIKGMTQSIFMKNVEWYLRLLRPRCEFLLWVGLSQVIELKKYPQNNTQIVEWNEAVEKLLRTEYFSNWTMALDVFTVTATWKHENPVHLMESYYGDLAELLVDAVLGGAYPTYY